MVMKLVMRLVIKLLSGLAVSLLSFGALMICLPVLADTVDARCDLFPAGKDRAPSSGLCTFSQRQGYVTIRLKNGQTIERKPNESTSNAFFDSQGEPARREILDAKRGHVYRLATQSIVGFWDPASYKRGVNAGKGSSVPGSGTSTAKPPELVRLPLSNDHVTFEGSCRAYL
ncbi:hypothetical protein [Vulcanococcus limneticus]|uniref:hypothetical protein n=1 Tax=Vulcanococcus limneticus TaxID=2170428 RepID=UPI00398BE5A1